MILFFDLDGTLTDTADVKYKDYKDGIKNFNLSDIPVFPNAVNLINTLKKKGHRIVILSDSHPNYVRPIAEKIFNVEYLYLTDKPNTAKTLSFIHGDAKLQQLYTSQKEQIMIIGDSTLDIQLGRKLKIPTTYLQLYTNGTFAEDDGLGDERTILKYGPTYMATNYQELYEIIEHPMQHLLSIEASSIGYSTCKSVRFWSYYDKNSKRIVAFRCLARQENGSCDSYSKADLYYQIDNPQRSIQELQKMSLGVENYLNGILENQNFTWDYFTYVSDKSSTTPPNKLKEIFDLVNTSIPKEKLFVWKDNITSSLRNEKDYKARLSFIQSNLFIRDDINLEGKNIIVLDDQLTTGATAFSIRKKLEEKKVGNIIILTLFYMSLLVLDDKKCPNCGRPLVIKTNRRKGTKFYSCQPPRFGGDGCGYIENI